MTTKMVELKNVSIYVTNPSHYSLTWNNIDLYRWGPEDKPKIVGRAILTGTPQVDKFVFTLIIDPECLNLTDVMCYLFIKDDGSTTVSTPEKDPRNCLVLFPYSYRFNHAILAKNRRPLIDAVAECMIKLFLG